MLKKISLFFLVFIITSAFGGLTGYGAEDLGTGVSDEAYHNQKGLSHFKKGFYSLTPQHRKEEASQEYGLAIKEFQKAITLNKKSVQAHRNLARVYDVQKRYLEAAEEYKQVTDLEPMDIDTYVLTALAYTQIQRYDEAIEQLEIAKTFATDEAVIDKLSEYIEKVEQEKESR